jgi:DNA-binding NarL/FixJ family response regulator
MKQQFIALTKIQEEWKKYLIENGMLENNSSKSKKQYRSKLDSQKNKLKKYLNQGISKTDIAKKLNVSRSTLYNFLNTRKI